MLVAVTGLGSIWSCRPGRNAASIGRLTREAAFFNTTGIRVDGTLRCRSRVYGEVRFNGSTGLDPHNPATSMLHRVFRCPALTYGMAGFGSSATSRCRLPRAISSWSSQQMTLDA